MKVLRNPAYYRVMKIEWFLEAIDNSAHDYLELREQLTELPADSPLYSTCEKQLYQKLLELKRESSRTLATLEGLFDA